MKQFAKRPGSIIVFIKYLDRIYGYNERNGLPVPTIVSWLIYLIEQLYPIHQSYSSDIRAISEKLNKDNIYSESRKRHIYQLVRAQYWKYYYKPVLMKTGSLIIYSEGIRRTFQKLISLAVQNWPFLLNFGYFKWCAKSPLRRFYLVILSSLLGLEIGYFISPKRSEYFAKISCGIYLFLNITKYALLCNYKQEVGNLIDELLRRGWGWDQILFYLAEHYPEYYIYLIGLWQHINMNVAVSGFSLISEMNYSGIKVPSMSNNEITPDIQRLAKGLGIFETSKSSYISYQEVIIEPENEVQIQAYKFMLENSQPVKIN